MGIIKLIILASVAVVIIVVAVVAVAAVSLISSLNAEPEPPSPEVVAQGEAVERKIEAAVTDTSAFYLELNDEELSALLLARASAASSAVQDIEAHINPGSVDISGSLGGTPAVPFSGSVDVAFESGQIDLELQEVSLSFLPVPSNVQAELEPLIDQGLDVNEALNESGAAEIQRFEMEPGKVTIVGIQRGGKTVSDAAKEAFTRAFQSAGAGTAPVAPGAEIVPPGTAGKSEPGADLYLALGDSLAANVGAATPQDGYVSRFHAYLERETGRDLGLMNLGISGESSISIMDAQLQQALTEIRQRRDDGDPSTRVSVLTLDLGANDLLTHLGSQECQQEPRGEACQTRIDAGLDGFSENFPQIVSVLASEMEPDAEFYIVTMYNPFDFGLGIPFEDFSNEIVDRLNGIIRENAESVGARLADPYGAMGGRAAAWTNMLQGDIHPNADGFQVLAFSLAQAREG